MGVPARVRLVLALAVTFALTPMVQTLIPLRRRKPSPGLALLIGQEITAGVLVGAMAAIIMSALQVAGFLIASQIGLSYAQSSIPPRTRKAPWSALSSRFWARSLFSPPICIIWRSAPSWAAIACCRPGGHLPTSDMAQLVIQLVSSSFALGFQLAAPFLVFGFAVYAALGVLARLMPQLQVFFLAMPINILCGFVIMLALLGSMITCSSTITPARWGCSS